MTRGLSEEPLEVEEDEEYEHKPVVTHKPTVSFHEHEEDMLAQLQAASFNINLPGMPGVGNANAHGRASVGTDDEGHSHTIEEELERSARQRAKHQR